MERREPKVKNKHIKKDPKITKFESYLKNRKLKKTNLYRPYSNDEIRKMTYEK